MLNSFLAEMMRSAVVANSLELTSQPVTSRSISAIAASLSSKTPRRNLQRISESINVDSFSVSMACTTAVSSTCSRSTLSEKST